MTQETHFLLLARQLGVRVESPFFIRHEGAVVQFVAHLPDYGGPNGMVLLFGNTLDCDEHRVARANGYYFSALNGNAETSENDVRATLDDWGYFGPDDTRPAWHTGKP